MGTRKILAGLALATAMMAFGGSAQAAPLGNMTPLPNLAPLSEQAEPAHCRRYRHCHSVCHGWRWKRRCHTRCHRC